MANLTFTRCPGVGNLTLASRKCQNPLGMPPPPPTLGLNIDRCITIANVRKGLLRKMESRERLANCWYVNGLIVRVGSRVECERLKEESVVVTPCFVEDSGMIEMHVMFHLRHWCEIVKLRPIRKGGKCRRNEMTISLRYRRLKLRCAIVERN